MKNEAGKKFEDFIGIVKKLRRECPWDREQTMETLKPYLVEEVYEAIEAINDKDYKRLTEELGDMLLHVVMLSVFAAETGKFNIEDVVDSISGKMVRRHPHVFARGKARTKEDVWMKWEKIKGRETREEGRKHKGILESVPQSLPALYRADKVQRRAARVGFDWDRVAGAWDKVHEELEEVHELLKAESRKRKAESRIKEEIGDLLFAIVNVARKLNIDAEEALQQGNNKFMRRFSKIEEKLQKKKMTLRQMDALWDKVKASEM
jgi:tetrapyrrole methylase family protein/MazG family protein